MNIPAGGPERVRDLSEVTQLCVQAQLGTHSVLCPYVLVPFSSNSGDWDWTQDLGPGIFRHVESLRGLTSSRVTTGPES